MSSTQGSANSYLSQLYNRASNMIYNATTSSQDGENRPLLHGQRDQSAYGTVPENRIPVPKPRKVQTPIKVEAKVWFANERTWISWLRASVLMGTLALALFNSSTFYEDVPGNEHVNVAFAKVIRNFGIVYALISVFTLLWGLYSYQRRVSLIKMRWPGSFDDLIGPPVVCALTFIAILANFIIAGALHIRLTNTLVHQRL